MGEKKVPFITECCGEGCGVTMNVSWIEKRHLSVTLLDQFDKYGKVVSHGMCDDCQKAYYGKVYAKN